MKQIFESGVMEKIKKGYQPVYYGEEGFIVISIKAYLAAAEYAGAESSYFYYGDVCFDLINVNNRSDEIEAEDYDFMPRKVDFDDSSDEIEVKPQIKNVSESGCVVNLPYLEPAGETKAISADNIFLEVEDIKAVYVVIANESAKLAMSLYNLYCDSVLNPKDVIVHERIQALMSERERYEKILSRLASCMARRKHLEVKKE